MARKSAMSVLRRLMSKNRRGRKKSAIAADKKRVAKKAGYRRSKSGKKYYEARPNRSDINPRNKF